MTSIIINFFLLPGHLPSFFSPTLFLANIAQNGICIKERKFFVKLKTVICDAPARAFIKGIKNHNGYSSCEWCTQKGVWHQGRMIFPEMNASLRTHYTFKEISDPSHHVCRSPFADLELGLVSNFPLDYMHLVCLGITRKLIYLWLNGPLITRLPHRLVMLISEDLISICSHIPSEFARKPRTLKEVAMWKATEHRQFLLYTGMVVLRAKVSSAIYNNFLLLSICMRALLSEEGIIDIDYTKQLLVSFVTNAAKIYGKQILVYRWATHMGPT